MNRYWPIIFAIVLIFACNLPGFGFGKTTISSTNELSANVNDRGGNFIIGNGVSVEIPKGAVEGSGEIEIISYSNKSSDTPSFITDTVVDISLRNAEITEPILIKFPIPNNNADDEQNYTIFHYNEGGLSSDDVNSGVPDIIPSWEALPSTVSNEYVNAWVNSLSQFALGIWPGDSADITLIAPHNYSVGDINIGVSGEYCMKEAPLELDTLVFKEVKTYIMIDKSKGIGHFFKEPRLDKNIAYVVKDLSINIKDIANGRDPEVCVPFDTIVSIPLSDYIDSDTREITVYAIVQPKINFVVDVIWRQFYTQLHSVVIGDEDASDTIDNSKPNQDEEHESEKEFSEDSKDLPSLSIWVEGTAVFRSEIKNDPGFSFPIGWSIYGDDGFYRSVGARPNTSIDLSGYPNGRYSVVIETDVSDPTDPEHKLVPLSNAVTIVIGGDTGSTIIEEEDSSDSSANEDISNVDCTLRLDAPYYCRYGPGKEYPKEWSFSEGEELTIIGAYDDWYLVEVDDDRTRTTECWIGGGEVVEDSCDIPIVEPPPWDSSSEDDDGTSGREDSGDDTGTGSSGEYYPIEGCASSRLHVGDWVGLTSGVTYVSIRSTPDTHPSDNKIGKIQGHNTAEIIGGPKCNYGWLLWKVRTDDCIEGWVPETDGNEFWLSTTSPVTLDCDVDEPPENMDLIYLNDFTEALPWHQRESLITYRCDHPLEQKDGVVFISKNGGTAGYLELPYTIPNNPNSEIKIEVRFRYNDNGGMYIGLFENNEFICEHVKNPGVIFNIQAENGDQYRLQLPHLKLNEITHPTSHDGKWHVAELERNKDGYWSMYIDEIKVGEGENSDFIKQYNFLSITAYGNGTGGLEFDYIKVFER